MLSEGALAYGDRGCQHISVSAYYPCKPATLAVTQRISISASNHVRTSIAKTCTFDSVQESLDAVYYIESSCHIANRTDAWMHMRLDALDFV